MSTQEAKTLKEHSIEELKAICTDKQKAFVDEYIANGFNGTRAVLEVYATTDPRTASSMATENLGKPYIKELVRRYFELKGAARDEVVARIAQQARGDIGDILKVDEDAGVVEVSLQLAKDLNLTHLIKRVKQNKRTEKREDGQEIHYTDTTVELYSSATALDKLARIHGLFKDNLNLEVEGVVGVLKTGDSMGTEEWVAKMAEMRKAFNELNANGE